MNSSSIFAVCSVFVLAAVPPNFWIAQELAAPILGMMAAGGVNLDRYFRGEIRPGEVIGSMTLGGVAGYIAFASAFLSDTVTHEIGYRLAAVIGGACPAAVLRMVSDRWNDRHCDDE